MDHDTGSRTRWSAAAGEGSQPRNYPLTVTISLQSVTLEPGKPLNRSA